MHWRSRKLLRVGVGELSRSRWRDGMALTVRDGPATGSCTGVERRSGDGDGGLGMGGAGRTNPPSRVRGGSLLRVEGRTGLEAMAMGAEAELLPP